MAKRENQKGKLLRILGILMECTDEENGITMKGLIEKLEAFGIDAERKSIYSDFAVLEELGFPVIMLGTKPPTYTLGERIFQLPELKLLVDAVQSSKFITEDKSRQIIKKLKIFAGSRGAGELSRQVFIEDRVKTENKETLYAIDSIHKSINEGSVLTFGYFDYTVRKEKVLRHGGERYRVAPKALIWCEENYYLVAYDLKAGIVKNFRVDKMHATRSEGERIPKNAAEYKINPADYSNKIFGMYGGEEQLVTLEARERLSGAVIDRFGKSYQFIPTEFGFKVSLRVMVSPTFFSWVMAFGEDMRIIAPVAVREEMRRTVLKILENYTE